MNNDKINNRIQKRLVKYEKNTKIDSDNYFNIEEELTNRNLIFENSNEYKRKNKINTDFINEKALLNKLPEETIIFNDPYNINLVNIKSKENYEYKFYKHQNIPVKSKFPDMGVNMPKMTTGYNYNVLSNNTVDIENEITNRNVILTKGTKVKRKEKIHPNINNLNMLEFFEKQKDVYIPEPLIIERCQRPKGPFCQR